MTLTIRPITGLDELDLFNRLPYQLNDQIATDFAAGRRHAHWLWVALRDDRLTARVAFWSRPGDPEPMVIDVFDVDREQDLDDGVRLLERALSTVRGRPEFTRFLPPDWRADPGPAELRMRAVEALGGRLFVERLRLHWPATAPLPPSRGRLTFREPHGADELIDLMTRVMTGTLDAHGRDELTRRPAGEAARAQYHEELLRYPSPREWWRVGELPDGTPAGFVLPAHNGYHPVIAYIGVVPEARGRGLVDDLLAAGTRLLAEQGVPHVRAATDVGNTPMAAAFDRAGYRVFERQIDMVWS
ncbi:MULTISPECIES: GNAT family N-acetyltransferase [Catenuloplanes]|uniref:RimJ/RimL family protein N-acetyltransferase n=1 Tax=Catenuloplanes niger TaxID=587534 RepID=A0AAE4A0E3_9ACTN|nr:GNAT family N-acetyltransferase [Catenuloplanes niger]MDR7326910.1 RimJ/RimL family protein N-acetyltransferase [Catenuloplanes niger]